MTIFIDADACPVTEIAVSLARKYRLPAVLYCDTSHELHPAYGEVRRVSRGADAADFALTTACRRGDIVVTQDFGVAAMILGKGACGIHQSGKLYTDENIDMLLAQRYEAKKARRTKGRHFSKGPAKRTPEDDERFAAALEALIQRLQQQTEKSALTDGEPEKL